MKIAELEEYPVRPGTLREWRLHPLEPGDPDATPPSYNQEWHFRGIDTLRSRGLHTSSWLAIAFDVEGALDLAAFRTALTVWMRRHETLRSGFQRADTGLSRFTVRRDAVRVVDEVLAEPCTHSDVVRQLGERLDWRTDGARWPNHVVETIERSDSTAVVAGFDHSNVDGYSLLATAHELRELYETVSRGGECDDVEISSYLDFSQVERATYASMDREHSAVAEWTRFVSDAGGALPGFPLDLGVPDTGLVPHALYREQLLDPAAMDAVETVCRRSRSTVLAGVLTAAAIATYELCGQSVYRTVSPFHTRTRPEWATSMGWYIGAGPVEIDVGDSADFGDVLPSAQHSVRSAMRIARTPFVKVCELLGLDSQQRSGDMFSFLSYIDMREIPGAAHWTEWNAHALLRMTYGDDKVNMWGNRSDEGLHLVARHPDTPQARVNVPRFVARLRAVLRTVAQTGSYPVQHHVVL